VSCRPGGEVYESGEQQGPDGAGERFLGPILKFDDGSPPCRTCSASHLVSWEVRLRQSPWSRTRGGAGGYHRAAAAPTRFSRRGLPFSTLAALISTSSSSCHQALGCWLSGT